MIDLIDLHGNAEGEHLIVVVAGRVIGNDHSVGDDQSGSVARAGEQTERMARVEHQRLFIRHLR